MHSIMRLRFWRHAHAIDTVRPVAHSVKSRLRINMRMAIPSRYGRQAALHLMPSTSLTFSSSLGDNADIVGGIALTLCFCRVFCSRSRICCQTQSGSLLTHPDSNSANQHACTSRCGQLYNEPSPAFVDFLYGTITLNQFNQPRGSQLNSANPSMSPLRAPRLIRLPRLPSTSSVPTSTALRLNPCIAVSSTSSCRRYQTDAGTRTTDIPDYSHYRTSSSHDGARMFQYFVVGSFGALTAVAGKATVTDFLGTMSASADVLAMAKVEVDLSKIPEAKNLVIK